MTLPQLSIRGRTIPYPIIQGGMGIGISLNKLAGAVIREGGAGVISCAGLDFLISAKLGRKVEMHDAVQHEVEKTAAQSEKKGVIGVNIMRYLDRTFESSIHGAIDAKADMIICGAGLPLALPDMVEKADIALIPIVSSLRALQLICKRWSKKNRRPDAVVVEGPLAGGHLGFAFDDLQIEANRLENLFPPIKDFAMKNGDFPVIVAGGIYTNKDIISWISRGADGVQMGTRFLATEESGATAAYKEAVVKCKKEDIIVCHNDSCPPGSPSGMPFRTLTYAPMFKYGKNRQVLCNRGFVLQKDPAGNYTKCGAKENPERNFCICNGLLASCGYISKTEEAPLYTVGSSAHRVSKIMSVHALMNELREGKITD